MPKMPIETAINDLDPLFQELVHCALGETPKRPRPLVVNEATSAWNRLKSIAAKPKTKRRAVAAEDDHA